MKVIPGKTCSACECENPAVRGGLCWAHDAQRRRGMKLRPLNHYQGPAEHFWQAVLDYADADAEDDHAYRLAELRLKRAAVNFVLSQPGLVREVRKAGRPREVSDEAIRGALAAAGTASGAAQLLGMACSTICYRRAQWARPFGSKKFSPEE